MAHGVLGAQLGRGAADRVRPGSRRTAACLGGAGPVDRLAAGRDRAFRRPSSSGPPSPGVPVASCRLRPHESARERHFSAAIELKKCIRPGPDALRENLPHNSRLKVGGEPLALSIELIIKLLIVKSQLVQDGRVEVGNAYRIFNRLEAQLIRGSINRSPFDASAGQPQAERF